MPYLNKKEVEEQFDEKFANAGGDYDGSLEPIKSFISEISNTHLDSLIEHCKGMKRKKGSDDYVMSDQNSWYNTALSDLITHLHELKEQNK